MGNLFIGNITSIIDELVSYQTDPNYARADARREYMLGLGNRLAGYLSS